MILGMDGMEGGVVVEIDRISSGVGTETAFVIIQSHELEKFLIQMREFHTHF